VSGSRQTRRRAASDNNGKALTVSPLHMELYIDAARAFLDRALVEGAQPASIKMALRAGGSNGDDHRISLPENSARLFRRTQSQTRRSDHHASASWI